MFLTVYYLPTGLRGFLGVVRPLRQVGLHRGRGEASLSQLAVDAAVLEGEGCTLAGQQALRCDELGCIEDAVRCLLC